MIRDERATRAKIKNEMFNEFRDKVQSTTRQCQEELNHLKN